MHRGSLTRSAIGLLMATVLLLPLPSRAHAQAEVWAVSGPAEATTAVAVNPASDQQGVAAAASGIWRTDDGGQTWQQVSETRLGGPLAFDPRDGSILYGIGEDRATILRSSDGGATWAPVYTGSGSTRLQALVVDPNTPGRLFAGGSHRDGAAQVLRSTDDGATWAPVLPEEMRGMGGIGPTSVTALAALPGVEGLVLAAVQVYHGGFLAISSDGGTTWRRSYDGHLTPLAVPGALAVAGDAAETATIYLGLNVLQYGTLLRSRDGGASWTDLGERLPLRGDDGGLISNIVVDPARPGWLVVSMWDAATPPRTGVFASQDGGESWAEVGDLAPGARAGSGLAFAPASRVLFAATDRGVFRFALPAPDPSAGPGEGEDRATVTS